MQYVTLTEQSSISIKLLMVQIIPILRYWSYVLNLVTHSQNGIGREPMLVKLTALLQANNVAEQTSNWPVKPVFAQKMADG